MTNVTIIDYGLGNIQSIANMVKRVGGIAEIACSSRDIQKAQKLILPGVGAFDHGMNLLHKKNFIPVLKKKIVKDGIPILGICLGAQLFMSNSEEGKLKGLGWIEGNVRKFVFNNPQLLKVPHVGWNTIQIKKKCPLLTKMKNGSRFYFTHSYYIDVSSKEDVVATTEYGIEFVSIFNKDTMYGVQFHPEKSHVFGMALIKNFLTMT